MLAELALATAAAAAAAAMVTAADVLILSALYMSCKRRMTDVSPTVSWFQGYKTFISRNI
jgi:hypothetical protein